jgi:hypothetical protein
VILKLVVAAFLLGHAAVHASFLAPRPAATAGGPQWPFDLAHSWVLSPLGLGADATRMLGTGLIAAVLAGYLVAGLAAVGVLPDGVWTGAVVLGSVASIALLGVFFHPWLVVGVAIDAALIWLAIAWRWAPSMLGG